MIWAGMTLVKAWYAADQPEGSRVLGMYEDYSIVIGAILDMAGIVGFWNSKSADDDSQDIQSETERWFVSSWWERQGDSIVLVRDLDWATTNEDSRLVEFWGPDINPKTYLQRLGAFIRSIVGKTYKPDDATVIVKKLA
jgi:hypothetical protein